MLSQEARTREKTLKTMLLPPPSPLMPQSLDGYKKPRPMRLSRADVTCMHPPPPLQLSRPEDILRLWLGCTNTPSPLSFLFSFLRQELPRFRRSRKTFRRTCPCPTRGGIRAHFLVPSIVVIMGFAFSRRDGFSKRGEVL